MWNMIPTLLQIPVTNRNTTIPTKSGNPGCESQQTGLFHAKRTFSSMNDAAYFPNDRESAGSFVENGKRAAITIKARVYRICAVALLAAASVTAQTAFADSLPNFAKLVEEEGDAVVKIAVVSGGNANPAAEISPEQLEQMPEFLRRFYDPRQQRRSSGFGSGFIISDDGLVITNAHVIDGANHIRVSLADQREFDAEVIGSDRRSDIAVVKIDADNLPTAKLGDSDDVKVGEWVLAIGSPFGFEHTATQGIVSAVARNLPDETYVPFIQSDAAVNPGNSGGPLFNTSGEVIGVNSQIYSRTGGYQGLSFAVPINVAKSIAEQLQNKGYASRGWLGVAIQDVDQSLAESFGLDRPTGALVSQIIADSPAEAAGLKAGDIILSFNDKTVDNSSKLPPIVGSVIPDTTVPVEILRDGAEKTMQVKIAELEEENRVVKVKDVAPNDGLGITVEELAQSDLEQLGLENGLLIKKVEQDSPAQESGLQPGDILVSINRQSVETADQLDSLAKNLPREKSLPVLVQRGENRTFIPLTIPDES